MASNNPIFNSGLFDNVRAQSRVDGATIQGTINKTGVLLVLALLPAMYTWEMAATNPAGAQGFMWLGVIGGLIAALACRFRPTWAPVCAPLYALLEGLALGGISAFFNAAYPGIAVQAIGATFGTLAALLLIYKTGLISVTDRFRAGVAAATMGIAIFYGVAMLLQFFGVGVPFLNDSGLIGIGFSLFVVAIASMNLVLDFDFIEKAERQGAPKVFEWIGALGLMVTLVWLYIEMLRLLSKLRDNRS